MKPTDPQPADKNNCQNCKWKHWDMANQWDCCAYHLVPIFDALKDSCKNFEKEAND